MDEGNEADDEQARDQEPDPDIHDRFNHGTTPPDARIFFTTMPRPRRRCQRPARLT
jgi:hypothetical protein